MKGAHFLLDMYLTCDTMMHGVHVWIIFSFTHVACMAIIASTSYIRGEDLPKLQKQGRYKDILETMCVLLKIMENWMTKAIPYIYFSVQQI